MVQAVRFELTEPKGLGFRGLPISITLASEKRVVRPKQSPKEEEHTSNRYPRIRIVHRNNERVGATSENRSQSNTPYRHQSALTLLCRNVPRVPVLGFE